MSVWLRLKQIVFQSDVRSRPHRENYAEIEAAVNDLQNQIDGIANVGSAAEVVSARDYHSALRNRVRALSTSLQKNVLISGGEVTPYGVGSMALSIAAGEAEINGVGCSWASQTSAALPTVGTVGWKQYHLVVAKSDNSISVTPGTAALAANAKPPICTGSQKALYLITVIYGQTSILVTDIFKVYRESAVEGTKIWMVERNPNMDFHWDIATGGNFTLHLPYTGMKAGDRVRIVDNRHPTVLGANNYIEVKQFYGGAWNKIDVIYFGGVELLAMIDEPVANGITTGSRYKFPYASGASCAGVAALAGVQIILGNLYYVNQPNPVPGWNLVTGQWTAPFDGIVSAEAYYTGNGTARVQLYRNGIGITQSPASLISNGAGPVHTMAGTFRFPVSAGDVLDMRPNNNATAITATLTFSYVH